ncbi:MAG: TrmB family transcriptional regulator [Candidatus Cloacimonetes bacterium]|nr:TrmB family transcriptional regulator [Candidatus Cloacimonadota bacterium]
MPKTDSQISQNLVKLGLSEKESLCYLTLLQGRSLTAVEVAKKIDVLPNAIYRLIGDLENKGFVIELNSHPKRFQAKPPETAFDSFLENQNLQVQRAKTAILQTLSKNKKTTPQTLVILISGRNNVFREATRMYKKAQKEILLISIGEPIPDELILAMRDALARKVEMKMIAHKYDEDNKGLLSAWSKMGMEIRHYPDWGFHLLVCDGKRSLLTANNPEATEERTGMLIFSEALSSALRDYFFAIWEKAEKIS